MTMFEFMAWLTLIAVFLAGLILIKVAFAIAKSLYEWISKPPRITASKK